jgi:hypothetical protein
VSAVNGVAALAESGSVFTVRSAGVALLIQQLTGPMLMHMLSRPALDAVAVIELPDLDTVCTVFAENFVRAVATQ